MQRRIALAISLAFTIIVTFSVLTLGTQAGWFSDHHGAKLVTAAPAQSPIEAAPPPQAPVDSAPPEPRVVTEYVYVDQPRAQSAAPPAPAPASAGGASSKNVPTPPPTSAPSPSPVQTTPPQATSTTVPPATATDSPPASPTPKATHPQSEIEFVGTVVAISGNVVTFSHGGTTTDITVNHGLSSLHVGDVVHVHAILSGGVYVADEIGD